MSMKEEVEKLFGEEQAVTEGLNNELSLSIDETHLQPTVKSLLADNFEIVSLFPSKILFTRASRSYMLLKRWITQKF